MKKIFAIVIMVTFLIASSLVYWWSRPNYLSHPVIVEIPKGATIKEITTTLMRHNILTSEYFFLVGLKLSGVGVGFQAGKYKFPPMATPFDVIQMIGSGQVFSEVVWEIVVPEGEASAEIYSKISRDLDYSLDMVVAKASHFIKSEKLSKYHLSSLEGFLYPAKYTFYDHQPEPVVVIEKMVDTFFERIPDDYLNLCHKFRLSLREAVTFASLIEKETGIAEERHLVSEVIWNRLKHREPLGIDASIIYGIESFDGNLTTAHLKDRKNPYNTRRHRGLPPTPIGSPSKESLLAVFTPTDHGYNYYVLKAGNSGRHTFSKTLGEHNRAVRELVKYSRMHD